MKVIIGTLEAIRTHFQKELPDETYVKAIRDGRFANRDWDPSPINSD
ncbi:MAG: hypothetical protein ABGF52_01915 [Candidatus Asgardarchaeum sp.]